MCFVPVVPRRARNAAQFIPSNHSTGSTTIPRVTLATLSNERSRFQVIHLGRVIERAARLASSPRPKAYNPSGPHRSKRFRRRGWTVRWSFCALRGPALLLGFLDTPTLQDCAENKITVTSEAPFDFGDALTLAFIRNFDLGGVELVGGVWGRGAHAAPPLRARSAATTSLKSKRAFFRGLQAGLVIAHPPWCAMIVWGGYLFPKYQGVVGVCDG